MLHAACVCVVSAGELTRAILFVAHVQAIEQGNHDNARIYAENAIRKKQEATNFLRMSARLESTSQRVRTAMTMNKVCKARMARCCVLG